MGHTLVGLSMMLSTKGLSCYFYQSCITITLTKHKVHNLGGVARLSLAINLLQINPKIKLNFGLETA